MSHWASSFFFSKQEKHIRVLLPVVLWHSTHWYCLRFFFLPIYFIPAFLNIRNLWKELNFIQQFRQYSSSLYACVSTPHPGHMVSYILGGFLFIIPSIPQNKYVVKSLSPIFNLVRIYVKSKDSIFNLVRITVAAHLFLYPTRNCSAECPTRPAHSTAHTRCTVQHRINKKADKRKWPKRPITHEYG